MAKGPPLTIEIVIAFVFFVPSFLLFHHSISGDGAIYFTFIKNFWSLPFSFQPGTVSFGATSPLHVVIHSIVYALAGDNWIFVSKLINFAFIPCGVVLLNRARRDNLASLLMLAVLIVLSPLLLMATGQLFESSLSFFSVCLTYFLLKRESYRAAIMVSGTFYLIRPETVLFTMAVDAYILAKSERAARLQRTLLVGASMIPVAAYHLYMYLQTGELLPSSVVGRAVRAGVESISWLQSIMASTSVVIGWQGALHALGVIALILLVLRTGPRKFWPEIALFAPLPLPLALAPAGAYLARYLLPTLPIAAVVVVEFILWFCGWLSSAVRSLGRIERDRVIRCALALALIVAAVAQAIVYPRAWPRRYDYDKVLLKDLADQLNEVSSGDDRVLIYEIQSQYYINASCYSLDAIVGSHMLRFLKGNETLQDALVGEQIDFIVTMNSFAYRQSFNNTLLEELYLHDLSSNIGDQWDADSLRFIKILTNSGFSNPEQFQWIAWPNLNAGDSLRVYNYDDPLWAGHHPMWNSVYRVQLLSEVSRL